MANDKITGLLLNGSLKRSGVTFYTRNGQIVARSSHSDERRSNTRGQFDARQRMRHAVALWNKIKFCEPMFMGGRSSYSRFTSLANRLMVVYLKEGSLLLPNMPLSDGTLPSIDEWLGEVEGRPALLTDLKLDELDRDDVLRLYTVRQRVERAEPEVEIRCREVKRSEMLNVDGKVALAGEEYADEMCGWAIVRVNDDRCSTQQVVTRCNYYQHFTTEEAMHEVAKSYGGLTE